MLIGKTEKEIFNESANAVPYTLKFSSVHNYAKYQLAHECLGEYLLKCQENSDGDMFITLYNNDEYLGQFKFSYEVEVPDPTPDIYLMYLEEVK